MHNGCVYSDIDDGRQNLILWLLLVIDNIKIRDFFFDLTSSFIILYQSKS